MQMLHVLYINTDQLRTKNNSVSSKFSYFSRNEKCGSHWKGSVISSMNGRDFPHSHLYYRLSEMKVTWYEANSAYSYYFVMNLKYDSYILIIKAIEMHCFSIYLIQYSTCFGQVHCPSSGVSQHCISAICICHASSVGVC